MDDLDYSDFEVPPLQGKPHESKLPAEAAEKDYENAEWESENEAMDSRAEEKAMQPPLFLEEETDAPDDDRTDDWDYSDFEVPPLQGKPHESKLPAEAAEKDYENAEWEIENEAMDSRAEEITVTLRYLPLKTNHSKLPAEAAEKGYGNAEWESENEATDSKAEEKAKTQRLFLEGETDAPDVEKLSEALCGTDAIKPSSLLVRNWICSESDCWIIHHGSVNYFANIQDYECCSCLTKNPTAYEWTLTCCFLNGISLDFRKVENQEEEPICILCAFLSLCDLSRRIRGAKRQCDEATLFDRYFMHARFEKVCGYRLDNKVMHTNGFRAMESMLIAACRYGVPYSATTYDFKKLRKGLPLSCKDTRPPRRSLKVSSWFRVSVREVEKITRLIAHGFPLLATIPVGKCFIFLSGDEVYSAPDPDGCTRHAVVLHGSGVAMPKSAIRKIKPGEPMPKSAIRKIKPGEPMQREVYFRGRNSHGEYAHPSVDGKGQGADFNIWAIDLLGHVFGINLAMLDD